ncbi:MAG: hypothetical protein KDI36_08665 [Pseudomonadales bacterium]|nr:hypothetical protein [Pseudomonadales bacterium]
MSIRITKPFIDLNEENLQQVNGNLGIYQLADDQDRVLKTGYAGGKSLFGLQGELRDALQQQTAARFRTEITSAYLTRYQELLMLHQADFGELPPLNDPADVNNLGRLSPA